MTILNRYSLGLSLIFLSLFVNIHPIEKIELPNIVAFLGTKRVGKDTSADYLIRTYGYRKYALADPMKIAIKSLFNLNDEQLWGDEKDIIDPYWQVSPREIMQFIGIDTLFQGLGKRFPHIGNTFYIKAFERWRDDHQSDLIVISDLRMQQDVIALKEFGAFIIRLQRPSINETDSHISETQVSQVEGFDFSIVNDGTIEELEEKIEQAIKNYHR